MCYHAPSKAVCGVGREDREDFDLKAAEGNTGNQKRGRPEGSAGGGGSGGRRVFVNNLSEETTWQSLKEYFKQAGAVAHADVLSVSALLLQLLAPHQRDHRPNTRLSRQQGVLAGWTWVGTAARRCVATAVLLWFYTCVCR